MHLVPDTTPNVAMVATLRQRRQILLRVRVSDATAAAVAALAFPIDQDRYDRRPALDLIDPLEVQ